LEKIEDKIKKLRIIESIKRFEASESPIFFTNFSFDQLQLMNFSIIKKNEDQYYIKDNYSLYRYLFVERGLSYEEFNDRQLKIIACIQQDYDLIIKDDFLIMKKLDIDILRSEITDFLIGLIKLSNIEYFCEDLYDEL